MALNGTMYKKDSDQHKLLTRKLAVFVGSSNIANRIVESLDFWDLLHCLDHRCQVPGRAAVKKELLQVMIELKAKASSYIQEANKVSICADIWSKKGLTSSYLGVTCHFFSRRDHRRHCVTLAVRRMHSPHTADHVRELVDAILEEWDIPISKVKVVVTDNGSNMHFVHI